MKSRTSMMQCCWSGGNLRKMLRKQSRDATDTGRQRIFSTNYVNFRSIREPVAIFIEAAASSLLFIQQTSLVTQGPDAGLPEGKCYRICHACVPAAWLVLRGKTPKGVSIYEKGMADTGFLYNSALKQNLRFAPVSFWRSWATKRAPSSWRRSMHIWRRTLSCVRPH